MKKIVTALALATLVSAPLTSTHAQNTIPLPQAKQKFVQQSHKFTAAIHRALTKINQKQQNLTRSHQELLKYRQPNNTPQENRCLNTMLQRSTNVQAMLRNMKSRLQQAQKQLPNLNQRAQRVQNMQQLQQIAQQGNRLIDQISQTERQNKQQQKKLNQHVDNACKGL